MSGAQMAEESHSRLRAGTAVGVVLVGTFLSLGVALVQSTLAGSPVVKSGPMLLGEPRVVVLKAARTLHLFDGDRLVRTYAVDLGTKPQRPKRLKGDGKTPVGSFKITTKNAASSYHRFIGISYPDQAAADWGLAHGLVSKGEALGIRRALAADECPNWETALGGGIGIHGHRKGRDWTGGCVAVSDAQIDELFTVLRIGDSVEILP